jgi:hypothetical protein
LTTGRLTFRTSRLPVLALPRLTTPRQRPEHDRWNRLSLQADPVRCSKLTAPSPRALRAMTPEGSGATQQVTQAILDSQGDQGIAWSLGGAEGI